ncbi:PDZ domain-containing protein [Bifidobacterium sp.]|uniref:YlbL family protein n=1 Tax=Bifidobacterium sp. TaxID=41200 RepID=UPI0039EBB390
MSAKGALKAVRARGGDYFAHRSPSYLIGTVGFLLAVILLLMPSPYVVETPGPTQNVLGKSGSTSVISVSGGKTYKDKGSLLLVTVNAQGIPGYPVTNLQVLASWFSRSADVIPREAVIPQGQTLDEYERQNKSQMSGSQSAAESQALAFLKKQGIDTSGYAIKMHVDNIGGPSAGMMYTLGAIDMLTPQNESGGKTIAGTGTMDSAGKVGAIGGIRLKMLGARRDGATWFLAPASNCDEVVGHVPSGLHVVKVSTIANAYSSLVAIGQGKGDTLPQCAVSQK